MHITAWTALMIKGKQLKNCPLTRYALMQAIKECSTLRVVPRQNNQPPPKPVYKHGKQNNEIKNFLEFRKIFEE